MPLHSAAIAPLPHRPLQPLAWHGPQWRDVPALKIAAFRPESCKRPPHTTVKLAHTPDGLCGLFRVLDPFVRCTRTRFQDEVYKDSCVEFFVQPKGRGGYFNFEFNCGGALLASYITDSTRTSEGFKAFTRLSPEQGRSIEVFPSMPKVVNAEKAGETLWHLGFFIPLSLLEAFAGPLGSLQGQRWRGNFYKCADDSSHPHWGAWAPVDALNFHLPRCFGELRFT